MKMYITSSIEELKNAILIAEGTDEAELNRKLNEYIKAHNLPNERYRRYLLMGKTTFIDFGSWSTFAALVED